jgi:hypothetical protein
VSTQEQLDQRFTPPEWQFPVRVAAVMNTFFTCLMYSSGHPILLAVGAGSFLIAFLVDRWALLRIYRRPPRFDNAMALFSLHAIPYAIFVHLLFSIWVYSDPTVLYSPSVASRNTIEVVTQTASVVDDNIGGFQLSSAATSTVGVDVTTRLSRENTLPLFLLAVAFIFVWFFSSTVGKALLAFVRYVLCCGRCETIVTCVCGTRPIIKRFPPYTGPFESVLRIGKTHELNRREIASGARIWRDKYGQYNKIWVFPHREDKLATINGSEPHLYGDRMLTYEVIGMMAIPDYHIESNPAYRMAVQAIQVARNLKTAKSMRRIGTVQAMAVPNTGRSTGAGTQALPRARTAHQLMPPAVVAAPEAGQEGAQTVYTNPMPAAQQGDPEAGMDQPQPEMYGYGYAPGVPMEGGYGYGYGYGNPGEGYPGQEYPGQEAGGYGDGGYGYGGYGYGMPGPGMYPMGYAMGPYAQGAMMMDPAMAMAMDPSMAMAMDPSMAMAMDPGAVPGGPYPYPYMQDPALAMMVQDMHQSEEQYEDPASAYPMDENGNPLSPGEGGPEEVVVTNPYPTPRLRAASSRRVPSMDVTDHGEVVVEPAQRSGSSLNRITAHSRSESRGGASPIPENRLRSASRNTPIIRPESANAIARPESRPAAATPEPAMRPVSRGGAATPESKGTSRSISHGASRSMSRSPPRLPPGPAEGKEDDGEPRMIESEGKHEEV